MLALFRDLRRLRREIGLTRPDQPRSLAIRHVDAGSCNGCEHELNLTQSPYYDLDRYGLGIVASPRHADVLLVTGAVTTRMHEPLLAAYHAMPEPRRVAALGNCALGRNLLGARENLVGALDTIIPVDQRIPGCPPTPAGDRGRDPSSDRRGSRGYGLSSLRARRTSATDQAWNGQPVAPCGVSPSVVSETEPSPHSARCSSSPSRTPSVAAPERRAAST